MCPTYILYAIGKWLDNPNTIYPLSMDDGQMDDSAILP